MEILFIVKPAMCELDDFQYDETQYDNSLLECVNIQSLLQVFVTIFIWIMKDCELCCVSN